MSLDPKVRPFATPNMTRIIERTGLDPKACTYATPNMTRIIERCGLEQIHRVEWDIWDTFTGSVT